MKKNMIIVLLGLTWLFFAVFAYINANSAEVQLDELRTQLEKCENS